MAASGRPSSTAKCSGRLWVWSKKATGRPGKGVSVHARLNSPRPTPVHGLARISASVLAQMPKREADKSPSDNRTSPPKVLAVLWAQLAISVQHSRYISGAASMARRTRRDKRLSTTPQAAMSRMPTVPVRDAVSTTASTSTMPRAAHAASGMRCANQRLPLAKGTQAIKAHSSRLLRWLGCLRLPTARPGRPERAMTWPSAHDVHEGAKTCTIATAALSRPASNMALAKAAALPSPPCPSGRRLVHDTQNSSNASPSNKAHCQARDDGRPCAKA